MSGGFDNVFDRLESASGLNPSRDIRAFTGQTGAEASLQGAREQIAASREALDLLRGDLSPFAQFGAQFLPTLTDRLNNPDTIAGIKEDPLYQALFQNATDSITANQAARGKLGSGETLSALTNASLGIGSQIYNQRNNDLFNAISLGQNSAAQTGFGGAGILQDIGNASAAGGIGAANAYGQGAQNVGQLAGSLISLFASDRRLKRDVSFHSMYKGIKTYLYRYLWDEQWFIGVMADEVKRKFPNAVQKHDGFYFVDYGALKDALRS